MRRVTAILALVLAFLAASACFGAQPSTLAYQGVLRDGSGNVVPDGSYGRIAISTSSAASLAAGSQTIYFLVERSSPSTGQLWFRRYNLSVIFVNLTG